jgi:hypothetical protein
MHWDGTVSFGNILTILTTLVGLIAGGVRIAFHLQRSSDAMNNLASITERLQHAVEHQDNRLHILETEQIIQKEVSKRIGTLGPVVQVNK